MSTDVHFMLNDPQFTLINSNQIGTYAYEDFKTVKFSLLHAKNIRNDFGVPIWFSTHDKAHKPVPFVHLIYAWSKHSMRLDTDPFLSFRVRGHLSCFLYSHIQTAVKSSATLTSDSVQYGLIRIQSECRGRQSHALPICQFPTSCTWAVGNHCQLPFFIRHNRQL